MLEEKDGDAVVGSPRVEQHIPLVKCRFHHKSSQNDQADAKRQPLTERGDYTRPEAVPLRNPQYSKLLPDSPQRTTISNVATGIALKVGIPPDDYDKFSVMPQRGYVLQPRVAASATLGKESDLALNRNAVASALCISFLRKRRNRVAVEISFLTSSQGSRSGNPGLEAVAPLGLE